MLTFHPPPPLQLVPHHQALMMSNLQTHQKDLCLLISLNGLQSKWVSHPETKCQRHSALLNWQLLACLSCLLKYYQWFLWSVHAKHWFLSCVVFLTRDYASCLSIWFVKSYPDSSFSPMYVYPEASCILLQCQLGLCSVCQVRLVLTFSAMLILFVFNVSSVVPSSCLIIKLLLNTFLFCFFNAHYNISCLAVFTSELLFIKKIVPHSGFFFGGGRHAIKINRLPTRENCLKQYLLIGGCFSLSF